VASFGAYHQGRRSKRTTRSVTCIFASRAVYPLLPTKAHSQVTLFSPCQATVTKPFAERVDRVSGDVTADVLSVYALCSTPKTPPSSSSHASPGGSSAMLIWPEPTRSHRARSRRGRGLPGPPSGTGIMMPGGPRSGFTPARS
jgi:hypothetical protein